jgi:hypothetical protein
MHSTSEEPHATSECMPPFTDLRNCARPRRYHTHYDTVTSIDPERTYAVAAPTSHPVHERFRVASFRAALLAGDSSIAAEVLGELMLQSHASYSRCGLGSDGTDRCGPVRSIALTCCGWLGSDLEGAAATA